MGYYYVGDYYTRGDGLGSFFKKVGKAVGSIGSLSTKLAPVASMVNPALGMGMSSFGQTASTLLGGSKSDIQQVNAMIPLGVQIGTQAARQRQTLMLQPPTPGTMPGGAGTTMMPSHITAGQMAALGMRKRRRMNVLNPRALRRAIRRAKGFANFSRSVATITTRGWRGVKFKGIRGKRRR